MRKGRWHQVIADCLFDPLLHLIGIRQARDTFGNLDASGWIFPLVYPDYKTTAFCVCKLHNVAAGFLLHIRRLGVDCHLEIEEKRFGSRSELHDCGEVKGCIDESWSCHVYSIKVA